MLAAFATLSTWAIPSSKVAQLHCFDITQESLAMEPTSARISSNRKPGQPIWRKVFGQETEAGGLKQDLEATELIHVMRIVQKQEHLPSGTSLTWKHAL